MHETIGAVERNPRWILIPVLTFAGLISEVFSLLIEFPTGRLSLLLSSLSLALALGAVLWFYDLIRTWRMLASVAGVTIAVHLLTLYVHLPQQPHQYDEYVEVVILGSIRPEIALMSFGVALIMYVAFVLLTTPRCKIGWAVGIAFATASLNAITVTTVESAQRGAWINFTGFLWQPSLAFFLAVALALKGLIPAFRVGAEDSASPSSKSRFTGLGILLVFWVITGTWVFALVVLEGRRIHELQARLKAEKAKSLAEAPPFESLPAPAVKPLDQVLLMQEIYGFEPHFPNSHDYPVENNRDEMHAPFPERRTYSAMYGGGTTYGGVTVNVTEYPNSAWAKYEVRNTPGAHQFINDANSVKHLTRFGNNLFQDGPMYFIWASDDKVIFLYCEAVMPDVIDEFLKAYLAKYPSSL